MILATGGAGCSSKFESFLGKTREQMLRESSQKPDFYKSLGPSDLEKDVCKWMTVAAPKFDFCDIELKSGAKFPDIIAKFSKHPGKIYGVEVKSVKSDTWKTTGNSVLESNRIEGVSQIYVYFGKLLRPPDFRFRKYEECVSDVAVTHSPRYLVDMQLSPGETIFDKMTSLLGSSHTYENIRTQSDPIKPFVDYYKRIAKRGEEAWWMGTEGQDLRPGLTVRLWSNLSKEEEEFFKSLAFALFPEILGNSSKKFERLAAWLVARYGIVNPHLRDAFTAKGQVTLKTGGKTYGNTPRIVENFQKRIPEILKHVKRLSRDDASQSWGVLITERSLVKQWAKVAKSHLKSGGSNFEFDFEKMIKEGSADYNAEED